MFMKVVLDATVWDITTQRELRIVHDMKGCHPYKFLGRFPTVQLYNVDSYFRVAMVLILQPQSMGTHKNDRHGLGRSSRRCRLGAGKKATNEIPRVGLDSGGP